MTSARLVPVGGESAAPGRLAAMSGSITIAPVELTASKIADDNATVVVDRTAATSGDVT